MYYVTCHKLPNGSFFDLREALGMPNSPSTAGAAPAVAGTVAA